MASKLPPLSFTLKLLQFAGKLLLGGGLLVAFVGRHSLPLHLLPEELVACLYAGLLIPLGLGMLAVVWISRIRSLLQRARSEQASQIDQIMHAASSLPDPGRVSRLAQQMQKQVQKQTQQKPAQQGAASPTGRQPAAAVHVEQPAVRHRNDRTALIRR